MVTKAESVANWRNKQCTHNIDRTISLTSTHHVVRSATPALALINSSSFPDSAWVKIPSDVPLCSVQLWPMAITSLSLFLSLSLSLSKVSLVYIYMCMFVQYGTGSKSREWMWNAYHTRPVWCCCISLDAQGKNNWFSKVRLTLFRFGFRCVWQNNGVQAINVFVRCFKQRLIDNRWQDWNSRIDASDRFSFYRQFKTNHVQATYLSVDINKFIHLSSLDLGLLV